MNFLLNIIFYIIFCAQASANNNIQEVIPQFEKILIQTSKKEKIPGFAIGIVNKGQVVYLKGFGYRSLESKQPITPDTVFQLASLSKTLSGALIGILNQHDYLSLEHLVNNYLPTFNLHPGQLKIQHVATHTSGVPRRGFCLYR
jgi:CubicO group peptidase (beta-lactamase class C family)